jgi:hypothetical protein
VGFEPTFPELERAKTVHALAGATIVTGNLLKYVIKKKIYSMQLFSFLNVKNGHY